MLKAGNGLEYPKYLETGWKLRCSRLEIEYLKAGNGLEIEYLKAGNKLEIEYLKRKLSISRLETG